MRTLLTFALCWSLLGLAPHAYSVPTDTQATQMPEPFSAFPVQDLSVESRARAPGHQPQDSMFKVYLATTPARRAQGLTGATLAGAGRALLVVFDNADRHELSLGAHAFRVDVAFAAKSGRVLSVVPNVDPTTLTLATPSHTLATLILPAGRAQQINLQPGDFLIAPTFHWNLFEDFSWRRPLPTRPNGL